MAIGLPEIKLGGMIRVVEGGFAWAIVDSGRVDPYRRVYFEGEGNLNLLGRPVVFRAPGIKLFLAPWQEVQGVLTTAVQIGSPAAIQTTLRDGVPVVVDARSSMSLSNPADVYRWDPRGPAVVIPKSSPEEPYRQTRSEIVERLFLQAASFVDSATAVSHSLFTTEQWNTAEGKLAILEQARRICQQMVDEITLPPEHRRFLSSLETVGIRRPDLGNPDLNPRLEEMGIPPYLNRPRGITVRQISIENGVWQLAPEVTGGYAAAVSAIPRGQALSNLLREAGPDVVSTLLQVEAMDRASQRGSAGRRVLVFSPSFGGGGNGGVIRSLLGANLAGLRGAPEDQEGGGEEF